MGDFHQNMVALVGSSSAAALRPPPSPYRGVPGSTCSAAHHPFPPDSKTMGTGDIMRYAVIKFPLRIGGEESPNCHFICLRV